jgi:hypothetical protein
MHFKNRLGQVYQPAADGFVMLWKYETLQDLIHGERMISQFAMRALIFYCEVLLESQFIKRYRYGE